MFVKFLKVIPVLLSTALVVAFVVTAGAVPVSTEIESDSNTTALALNGRSYSATGNFLPIDKTYVFPAEWSYGGVEHSSWMATFETQGSFYRQEFFISAQELFPYFSMWDSENFYGYTSVKFELCLRYYRKSDVDTSWYPDTLSTPDVRIYYSENGVSNELSAYDNYYVDNELYITYVYSFSIYYPEPELILPDSLFYITIYSPPTGDSPDFTESYMSVGIMDNTSMIVYYNYDDRPPDYDFNDPNEDLVNDLWEGVEVPTIDSAVVDSSSNDIFNAVFSLDVVKYIGVPIVVSSMGLFGIKILLFKG